MEAEYKNWVPTGMIIGVGTGALAITVLLVGVSAAGVATGAVGKILFGSLILLLVVLLFAVVVLVRMYNAFSWTGKWQLAKRIIEGVSARVETGAGGKILDVGCGSGALSIACAKRNPGAQVMGIDRWGAEYASFSQALCEHNAQAEGVSARTSFLRGDARKLPFDDESFDAVTSNYCYHNIPANDRLIIILETLRVLRKGGTFVIHDIFSVSKYGDPDVLVDRLRKAGCAQVKFTDTTDGTFMSRCEAHTLLLSGSGLLMGTK
ncbi:hypothetical protein HMPREF1531_02193 [Propionibacterium sp. oral taxon 192 str. F0372]|uniref:class I SAM-dependent methyltransferase n=1 Tax=Propionibacterium sp. oral taxon 192 TaxID=671222 RepID=UPI000352FDA0|nr:class I SAM-dependent methyltransferase [Propionibacterium sp. oral taxon 192]EPH02877.1 hypothetical protein HMPREF1531_02193 [Propionibacterium sp. oral taxon 192 str. F0372]